MLRHAFGPGDITCVAIVPGRALVLDEITDFSISSHFDKIPVRRIGHRLPVGWASGSGSIAGTLVCAQMTQGALYKLRQHAGAIRFFQDEAMAEAAGSAETGGSIRARLGFYTSAILPQQLPPFHLMFVHANESGQMAISRLYNVTISDQGETKGARNLFTEEALQYQATYYEQIRLHRALSTEEMARLANKPVGFFNDTRGIEKLPESLASVAADFSDAQAYLLEEAEDYERRLRAGQVTSTGIADQGAVVYVRVPDGTPEGREVQAARSAGEATTAHSGELAETFELTNGTGTTRRAPIVVTYQNGRSGARGARRARLDVGTGASTWTVELTPGPDGGHFVNVSPRGYYGAVISGDPEAQDTLEITPSDVFLRPDAVELHFASPETAPPLDPAEPDGPAGLPRVTRRARYHQPITVFLDGDGVYTGVHQGYPVALTFDEGTTSFSGNLFGRPLATALPENEARVVVPGSGDSAPKATIKRTQSGTAVEITLSMPDLVVAGV
jgi:hypothetical protein